MKNEQALSAMIPGALKRLEDAGSHEYIGATAMVSASDLRVLLAHVAALKADAERLPTCWAVIDPSGGGSVEYTAAWKEACHEHISDCITEHDIDGAKGWVVRPLYVAPMLAAEPAKAAPGEWIEWSGGECPIADGVGFQFKFRNDSQNKVKVHYKAPEWNWNYSSADDDIVAYRVLP